MPDSLWYKKDPQHVLKYFKTSLSGLSCVEVKKRKETYGENSIPQQSQRSLFAITLSQFSDLMILILLLAAFISGFLGELADTIAILFIVIINAIIGASQDYRAQKEIASLRALSSPDAQVIRNSEVCSIASSEIVPGDIVNLEAGNIVPADIRLLDTNTLIVDESALTGESQDTSKDIVTLDGDDLSIGDRHNMVFKASLVTKGAGTGVVVATGSSTEIGRIAQLLNDEVKVKTPLQQRLSTFGRYLALAVLLICGVIFAVGLLQGQPLVLMFLTSISLAVAAIPEALPAVITISLAISARKLIKQQALVRNLPAVETLGSVTYICTDKTGTLTQNEMKVELVYTPDTGRGALEVKFNELGQGMAISNDVCLENGIPQGEATEIALFQGAFKAGFDKEHLQASMPRVAVLPFDSERKLMTTIHRTEMGQIAFVKGAPESLVTLCDDIDQTQILNEAEALANEGFRVLAYAMRHIEESENEEVPESIEHNLTFLGLVALIDPPRPEAAQAIADCVSAGITPVMITGDHQGTALAIAKRLKMANAIDQVVTGKQLAEWSIEDLAERVALIRVYARVSPEQKLQIVKALQQRNQFVAMTGDGVNDAPALKAANIGVSMGKSGTDVARQASDMVLLDDNFSTIVNAIKDGRRIFDNIRKFIKDAMSSNSGEIWTLLLAPFLALPIPLLPIHILWINLLTDGLPGLAFSSEPAEPGIMQRPPREPKENIFAHGTWQHIVWVGLFVAAISLGSMSWALSRGVEYWQTIVFTVLTVSQLFHSFAVRSERESVFTIGLFTNRNMLAAILVTFLLQMSVIYIPVLNPIFHTQPLPLFDLAICIGLSSLVLIAVEIEKYLIRKGFIYAQSAPAV
jgi:Ca2+-transporting ATPase